MEIMEDGNLVDRVRILLQRDMQYYQDVQTVLREPLCVRKCGGRFDFPRLASFAAIKIMTWWEVEFTEAFKRPSGLSCAGSDSSPNATSDEDAEAGAVVKKIQPSEFILLVVETSEQLLKHLHTLLQESLDHADLTVLTATLGAAALIRNCLWCYKRQAKGEIPEDTSEKLSKCYKTYKEMAEAVADRLLDLHNRLIALYILNEADSLSWESDEPFSEKDRCSYVIQMWWLYMQGTKTDLWNTVSPKMAQRVLAGMLNDSLTIIACRFIHGRPSLTRSKQFWGDAFNMMCCTARLALSVCVSGDEMIGLNETDLPIHVRDLHAKCYHILVCFLLRGAPLKTLFQVFRKGLDDLTISKPKWGPAPWLYVFSPELLGVSHDKSTGFKLLTKRQAAILELNVFKSQPQPIWAQLMKILRMDDFLISRMLLRVLVRQCIGRTKDGQKTNEDDDTCGGFLCPGNSCKRVLDISPELALHALSYILTGTGWDPLRHLVIVLKKEDTAWSTYLDRHQVWNQCRPPWLNAMLEFIRPAMKPIVQILMDAAKAGASTCQAMSMALEYLDHLHDCIPHGVLRIALAMDDNVPAHCRPIGGSVALQLLCSALYTALLEEGKNSPESGDCSSPTQESEVHEPTSASSSVKYSRSASAIAFAEAICSIDEGDKHTAEINNLLKSIRAFVEDQLKIESYYQVNDEMCIIEICTDEIAFEEVGRKSLKIVHEYLMRISDTLLEILLSDGSSEVPNSRFLAAQLPIPSRPLTHTMFHIDNAPFHRLLMNYEGTIDWELMFEVPLAVTVERIKSQVLARPDINNILQLEQEEREAANLIKKICTAGEILKRD
ncbi:uncharacterized protein LOC106647281 [Copidosoma floridanum]|uniref:uncharacterized protein LOC106647281 n=1 Tax=Copidosoma floridanum TaxID=29053 RepID=UPI000C6FB94D|nr:uncharacterized protein LOC106647281 [Copidosoma floridanum]